MLTNLPTTVALVATQAQFLLPGIVLALSAVAAGIVVIVRGLRSGARERRRAR